MAPTAQKPLVGHFDWPAMNPPRNSSRLHHSHSHYESPFQQFDMRPGVLQSTADFLSQQLAKLSADLARQPLLLKVFLVACAVAILGLALFLACARRRLEKQLRLHECRRHFYDDGDDDSFAVCEKVPGPVRGEGSWPETRREFGLKAGSHAQGASLKPAMPPFHVSHHSP